MDLPEFAQQSAERNKRPKWQKSWDFMFVSVGYAVGLGNVWRFPYMCFKYGGGAFLVAYVLFGILVVAPLLVLEISLGQKTRAGLVKSWSEIPIFKGIAFSQIVIMLLVKIMYPIILTWCFKFFIKSFATDLPWANCNNDWNTAACTTVEQLRNQTIHRQNNGSISAAMEFWQREVLNRTAGIEEPGSVRSDLVLYSLTLWVIFYLCTFKGIKISTKIIYVTCTLPVILIGVITVRCLTLEGAWKGITYYLTPKPEKLMEISTWVGACSQILYSNAPGMGVIVALGGFNDYHQNFWRDAFAIVIANFLTSFTAGFAVFSTLGYMATYQNTTIEAVATSGPGLAFVTYPEALSLLPFPQLWSALFFLTLLLLGLDSQFVILEALMSIIMDNVRSAREHRYGRQIVQFVLFVVLMLLGLPMLTQGGVYTFEMLNRYVGSGWCVFTIATCECVAVAWLYGFERYWEDIVKMTGTRRGGRLWLKISWKYVTPGITSLIVIYYLSTIEPLKYDDYIFPRWTEVVGHLISVSSIVFIPGYALHKVLRNIKEGGKLTQLLRPPASEDAKIVGQEDLPLKNFDSA